MLREKWLKVDRKLLVLVSIFVGIIMSVVTVKTLAYTDSSDFCQSCHIMNSVHDSFEDSTHAELACNDCHLPHESMAGKLVYKAKVGMGHVYYNSLGQEDIPDVLHPTESTQEVIQANCIECHESTLSNVSHDAKENCVDCHQSVPHGDDFKTEDYYQKPKSGELLEEKGGNTDNG